MPKSNSLSSRVKAYLLHQKTFDQQVKMTMMMKLAVVSAVLVAGCAAPVPKEALMDWPAFIASVPGSSTFDEGYKTSTIKDSAYRYGTTSLDRTLRSFVIWCKAQKGQVANSSDYMSAQHSFYQTAVDWNHQEQAFFNRIYHSTPNVCVDAQGQLIAAILVHQYRGELGRPLAQHMVPAPVIAFYTGEQAARFVDFYKNRRAVLNEQSRLSEQQQRDLQDENTRRLHANPKIGDTTNKGMIIDLRPPLALIQYNAEHRLFIVGKDSGWERISGLGAVK